ncbi:hypothetical protein LFAB_04065 [Lactiplantibacillus fabifermentans T30PCM01]|uniref:Uncharacterized protein n=1 Tax=Lactiplantibacillus fabifermentans T30PCM01 TaxID=1400520 RepID=W6TAL9_9LACO|nr:hypothetical protein [Lactiplantibacillus fabifermentans]ETY74983.1 hypothetical protein LFAB_04065 [Lactiplantibacillus fabifermentans T30PCM01]
MDTASRMAAGLKRAAVLQLVEVNFPNCPCCGSPRVAEIIYGLPNHTAWSRVATGRLTLGGCEFGNGGPVFYCHECHHSFGKNRLWTPDLLHQSTDGQMPRFWQKYCQSLEDQFYFTQELSTLATPSLLAAYCASLFFTVDVPAERMVNRFFCDRRHEPAIWFWVYAPGSIYRLDRQTHGLVISRKYGKHCTFQREKAAPCFSDQQIVEVSAAEFLEQVNQESLRVPQRKVQAAPAKYLGPSNRRWRHLQTHSAEILLDHTFRIQDDLGAWHYIGRLEKTTVADTSGWGYTDENWQVFYPELLVAEIEFKAETKVIE